MVDMVKCAFDVGIQQVLVLSTGSFVERRMDFFDGIVTGSSRSETVTLGFEFGFESWF